MMNIRKTVGNMLTRIPFIRYAYLYKHNSSFRPGHYYSPVADVDDLKERQDDIWAKKTLAGIDLNDDAQKKFLQYLLSRESGFDIPWKKEDPKRYYGESPSFQYVDGVVLHAMMAKYSPRQVIEVGSGASSGCMIDASVKYGLKTKFLFIEPEPQYCLDNVVKKEDYDALGVTVIKERVQKVSPAEFHILEENDILFIDSSHVSKPGSDVNYLLTEILPILKKGVIIHFHDIYYPFEYTKEYLLKLKLLWSEVYSLHNFLLFNSSFKILFFSDYMKIKLAEDLSLSSNFPEYRTSHFCNNPVRPKSLWIQRV